MQVYAATVTGLERIGECQSASAERMMTGTWPVAAAYDPLPGLPTEIVQAANPPVIYSFGAILKRRDAPEGNKWGYVFYQPQQISTAIAMRATYDVEIVVLIDASSPHPRWLPGWAPDSGMDRVAWQK